MACSLCRGSLVPIEIPTAETAFQCMVCGTVDTAEQMLVRSLRKAVRLATDQKTEESGEVTGRDDRNAVEDFLKSLRMKLCFARPFGSSPGRHDPRGMNERVEGAAHPGRDLRHRTPS